MRSLSAPAVLWLAACPLAAETPVDTSVVTQIRDEGFNRSKVMDTVAYLTDVIGPRLSGSPRPRRSQRVDARPARVLGPQQRPPRELRPLREGLVVRALLRQPRGSPLTAPLIALPKAWTPGTDGPVRGKVVKAKIESEADLEKWKGKLAGSDRAPGRCARPEGARQGALPSLHRGRSSAS